jgi:hypothetical protein
VSLADRYIDLGDISGSCDLLIIVQKERGRAEEDRGAVEG